MTVDRQEQIEALCIFYRDRVARLVREIQKDLQIGEKLKYGDVHIQIPNFPKDELEEWLLCRTYGKEYEFVGLDDERVYDAALMTIQGLLRGEDGVLVKAVNDKYIEPNVRLMENFSGMEYAFDCVISPFLKRIGYRLEKEISKREYEECTSLPHPDSCWSGCMFRTKIETTVQYRLVKP